MKLADVATYFDKTAILDGYAGTVLAYGQLDLFDDSKRDALGADRRILSIKPGVAMPDHRCISLNGRRYIFGDSHPDEFQGSTIREKFIVQEAPFNLSVGSTMEHLAGTPLRSLYAGGVWVKDIKLETYSSDLRDMYAFYVAPASKLPIDTIVLLEDRYYRVRSTYWTSGGYQALEANQLREDTLGLTTFTPKSGHYDPALDVFNPATSVEVPAFLMNWQDDYEVQNTAMSSWKSGYEPGDVRIRVHPDHVATIAAEDTFQRGSKVWTVISAYHAKDGSWSVHGRPM